MAKIQPELKPLPEGGVQLTLTAPGMDNLVVPQPDKNSPATQILLVKLHYFYLTP